MQYFRVELATSLESGPNWKPLLYLFNKIWTNSLHLEIVLEHIADTIYLVDTFLE